jgi:hypothetical protein
MSCVSYAAGMMMFATRMASAVSASVNNAA